MNHSVILNTIATSFCLVSMLFAGDANSSIPTTSSHAVSEDSLNLLPKPKNAVFTGKTIPAQRVRIVTKDFTEATPRLIELLKRRGIEMDDVHGLNVLKIQFKKSDDLKGEAYAIKMAPKQVTVLASNETGILNGIHTLVQLFFSVEG